MTKVEQHIIEFAEKHPIFSPPYSSRGFHLSDYEIALSYMAIGGIPLYGPPSAGQNIKSEHQ